MQISQQDNFKGNFGDVLRSSAIFYYKYSQSFRTTVSVLNYWRAKRSLDVAVICSLRQMDGKLLFRARLRFNDGEVLNLRPLAAGLSEFEGSLEVEVFALENMVIPYAAVMAVYESPTGLSMVHSYSRTYSRHEVEEGRVICDGEEGCWSLRDDNRTNSFCVFHNGGQLLGEQCLQIRVTNSCGAVRSGSVNLGAISPFATVKIRPVEILNDLVAFLDGDVGYANISFQTGQSFTRMLVGNERCDQTDMQVTHSNFNYAKHETDRIDGPTPAGFMHVPPLPSIKKKLVVFPEMDQGLYAVSGPDLDAEFSDGRGVRVATSGGDYKFTKEAGYFPSRLVTAIECSGSDLVLPNECSLGVLTRMQPRKRFWWGLCCVSESIQTLLVVHDVPQLFGGVGDRCEIVLRVYSSTHRGYLERRLEQVDLSAFDCGVCLSTLLPGVRDFLGADFGYYTVYCEYGGLCLYSMIKNEHGSVCFEHGF